MSLGNILFPRHHFAGKGQTLGRVVMIICMADAHAFPVLFCGDFRVDRMEPLAESALAVVAQRRNGEGGS